MENRAHALAAGLFTLLLGAAMVLAVWWFADQRDAVATYELVSTGSITGLNPQAQVRYRGMAAGKVTDIRIDPLDRRNILVRIEINADLPITRGTRASLALQGVTGLAFVQLDDRGEDPTPLVGTDGRPPRLRLEPGLVDQLTDTALDAVQRFKGISEQIGAFFDEDNLARFRSTLQTLESAASGIDRTFAEAPETLQAIRTVFSPANVRSLSATLANLERISGETAPAAVELRAVLQRFGEVLDSIDGVVLAAGDSLLDNTLPELNGLLKELTDTSSRVGRLVEEVEASPQMLITGRGGRRPGPGEAGFEPQRR
jgi:phospholipid/cholesterol/gamma-HCH transport system substrate-binding protein